MRSDGRRLRAGMTQQQVMGDGALAPGQVRQVGQAAEVWTGAGWVRLLHVRLFSSGAPDDAPGFGIATLVLGRVLSQGTVCPDCGRDMAQRQQHASDCPRQPRRR